MRARITWYHNIAPQEKAKDSTEREWYARQAIQFGWSRNVLVHQMESDLYARPGRALTKIRPHASGASV